MAVPMGRRIGPALPRRPILLRRSQGRSADREPGPVAAKALTQAKPWRWGQFRLSGAPPTLPQWKRRSRWGAGKLALNRGHCPPSGWGGAWWHFGWTGA